MFSSSSSSSGSLERLLQPSCDSCQVEHIHVKPCVEYPWHVSSKSLSIRALLLASFAQGRSCVSHLLDSDDTMTCLKALQTLNVKIQSISDTTIIHGGIHGSDRTPLCIHCGASGITLRFLMALLAARTQGPPITLMGEPSLCARNSQPLCDALIQLGYHDQNQSSQSVLSPTLPMRIEASGLKGGDLHLNHEMSSQFLSAVLSAAPLAHAPTHITLSQTPRSANYIHLTIQSMKQFGVDCKHNPTLTEFVIHPTQYQACNLSVEADMSSLCTLFMWAAIHGVKLCVPNFPAQTYQGDGRFSDVLKKFNCQISLHPHDSNSEMVSIQVNPPHQLRGGFSIDLSDMPDQVPTVAMLATQADAPVTLNRIGVVRGHECDRIAACESTCKALNIRCLSTSDSLKIWPMNRTDPHPKHPLDTFSDHRMAMALSILATKHRHLRIAKPYVVKKSFPGFYHMLADLGCVFVPSSMSDH